MASIYYHATDMIVEVDGLQDSVNGDYLNSASVQITLQDANNVPLTGQTWPVALVYVAASDGKYRATLDADINTENNATGFAVIDVDAGSGRTAQFILDLDFVGGTFATPDKSVVSILCYNHDTEVDPEAEIQIEQLTIPTSDETHAFDGHLRKYIADADGVVNLVLWRNAKYRYRRGLSYKWVEFTPDEAEYSVTSVVGL